MDDSSGDTWTTHTHPQIDAKSVGACEIEAIALAIATCGCSWDVYSQPRRSRKVDGSEVVHSFV